MKSNMTNQGKVSKSVISKRPQPKGGSRKGVPNKSTANAREAIARFVDGNSERLQGWLDKIAADEKQGPKAAMACFLEMLEYHVPKLARIEHAGEIKKSVTDLTDAELTAIAMRLNADT